ncbi:MAG: hypothetical protein ACLFPX_07140 [Candidatus Omnitrophota bacterium]
MKNKAQTTTEYAILIIIVLGALLAMQNYFKRGLQSRWRTSVDELSDQYDPAKQETNVIYGLQSNVEVEIKLKKDSAGDGFWTTRTDKTNSLDTRSGYSRVTGYP